MINPYMSVGVFFDGGYLAKVNEELENIQHLNIDISKLLRFLQNQIAKDHSLSEKDCQIVESHYFRGRFNAYDAQNKHLLYTERKFEDMLIENDIIFHYKHLREREDNSVIEKSIDVWFALEAYELACFRHFDFVVLMTGDADHEMLIRKLKLLKVRVILLTWNISGQPNFSKLLKEEAGSHIELGRMAAENKNFITTICKPA